MNNPNNDVYDKKESRQITLLLIKRLYKKDEINKTAFNDALNRMKITKYDIPKLDQTKLELFYKTFLNEILNTDRAIKKQKDEEKLKNRNKYGK